MSRESHVDRRPLLSEGAADELWGTKVQRLGSPAAAQSMVVSMLGTGIVAFPYGFALCGASSYGGLLQQVPAVCRHFTNGSLWLLLVLVSVAYTIIAGDIIRSVAAALGVEAGDVSLLQNRWLFAMLLSVVFLPALSSSFEGLHFVSGYCTVAIGVAVVLLVWQASEIVLTDPPPTDSAVEAFTDPWRSVLSVPIFANAMFGQMNVSQVFAELQPRLKARASRITLLAVCSTGVLYLAVGLVGYAAFGRTSQSDVIVQLTSRLGESRAVMATQGLLTSFVVLKMPFQILPLRTLTLEIARTDPADISPAVHTGITACLVGTVYLVALAIPDFAKVLELLGALCVIPLALILPGFLSWSLEEPRPVGRCLLLSGTGIVFSGLSLAVLAAGY